MEKSQIFKKLLPSQKITLPFVLKTILSDAESHEEYNGTYYNPIGWMTAKLCAFLCLGVVEITEKEGN